MQVGADSKTVMVHSAVVIGANVHNKHPLPELRQGAEKRIHADRGYQACRDITKTAAPGAREVADRRVRRPGGEDEAERLRNRTKSRARARVEHPFPVLERLGGLRKGALPGSGQAPATRRARR